MYIYKKISALCKNNNMTIKDLEQELGLSNGIIGKWKNASPNIKYLLAIAEYFQVDINELCYEINSEEDQRLLTNFHYSDQRGKETILNVAELEARRSRSERKQPDETQASTGKKINFVDLAVKQNLSYQGKEDQEDDEELKPFA